MTTNTKHTFLLLFLTLVVSNAVWFFAYKQLSLDNAQLQGLLDEADAYMRDTLHVKH